MQEQKSGSADRGSAALARRAEGQGRERCRSRRFRRLADAPILVTRPRGYGRRASGCASARSDRRSPTGRQPRPVGVPPPRCRRDAYHAAGAAQARRRPPSRRRFLYAAAAVAAVAAPAAVLLSQPDLLADHSTAVGERRKVTLEDGSTVELAGPSSLSVDFAAEARRVVLHDGEAFFDVARGTPTFRRPGGGRSGQALGTSFDVKRQGNEVTVAVVEHAVAVSSAERSRRRRAGPADPLRGPPSGQGGRGRPRPGRGVAARSPGSSTRRRSARSSPTSNAIAAAASS